MAIIKWTVLYKMPAISKSLMGKITTCDEGNRKNIAYFLAFNTYFQTYHMDVNLTLKSITTLVWFNFFVILFKDKVQENKKPAELSKL